MNSDTTKTEAVKRDGTFATYECPSSLSLYNCCMCGVDLSGQLRRSGILQCSSEMQKVLQVHLLVLAGSGHNQLLATSYSIHRLTWIGETEGLLSVPCKWTNRYIPQQEENGSSLVYFTISYKVLPGTLPHERKSSPLPLLLPMQRGEAWHSIVLQCHLFFCCTICQDTDCFWKYYLW